MSTVDDLRLRVAQACRVLGTLGLAKGATGHVSARVPGTDRVLIRARGPGELGVRFTTIEQIVEVGLDGKLTAPNEQGLDAPLEVFIHTSIYAARPDVHAAVHVHPLPVVLFIIVDMPILPLYGAYDPPSAKLAFKPIPIYPRSILCDTPERGDELASAMGQSNCCIMRGHGISTVGNSVEEAALTAIHLTNLAEVNYQARLLGDPKSIPKEEQDFFMRDDLSSPPNDPGARPIGRDAALWRYYVSLTDG